MHKQISLTTHAFCDVIESSRVLTTRMRLAILADVEQALLRTLKHIESVGDMTQKEKARPINKVFKDLRTTNPIRRRKNAYVQ